MRKLAMGLEVKIDFMSEHDVTEVISLGTSTPEFNTGTTAKQFYYEQTLKKWARDPNGVTLVAKIGNTLAGFALGYYMAGPNDGYINCIAVNQGYRRRGIGKKLLQRALSEFKTKGSCNHVFGVVESDNTNAINFFKNHGLEIGREFRYVERMI